VEVVASGESRGFPDDTNELTKSCFGYFLFGSDG
jgi:hypothetical protein